MTVTPAGPKCEEMRDGILPAAGVMPAELTTTS